MVLKYILLGLLSEPASGYDLKKAFEFSLRHFWRAKLSQIYTTLKKMEDEKLITSSVEPSPIGPDRKIYNRTEKGKSELLEWLSGEPLHADVRFHYAAQAFFLAEKRDPESSLRFYKDLREIFKRDLAVLTNIEHFFKNEVPGFPDNLPDDFFYPYLTLKMGFHKIRGNIKWCEECIKLIKKHNEKINQQ